MEKLISKNVIQRFKEGGIPKYQSGKHIVFKGTEELKEDPNNPNYYVRPGGGKVLKSSKTGNVQIYSNKNKNGHYYNQAKYNGKTYNIFSNGEVWDVKTGKKITVPASIFGLSFSKPSANNKNKDKVATNTTGNNSTTDSKLTTNSKTRTSKGTGKPNINKLAETITVNPANRFMNTPVQKGWTRSYGNNLWNGISDEQKQALIGTGKFTEDSFKDARSLQTALNKYFEGNAATMNNRDFTASRIAVDNKWGDQSQKALMHALSMANYDEARPLNVNVNPVNPLNGLSTISAPTKIEARPEHMYNRTEVRQLLRNQGINPYSLSGAQRQAIRFALNGGHEYNKALLQGIDLKRLTQPVTLRKSGGKLISKDPVKQFKQGGSIAKYGLGNRMASYVKKKKSELNRAKAAANSWSGYELTYPEFTQNGIATKGVISGRNYVPEATVTASKEGARKSRLTEASKRNASLAKMQDTLFRIGAYDRNKTQYRQAVDGMMGGLTRNAIKRAREMGYEVNEKTGEIRKLNRKGLHQKAADFVHNANEKMKSVKGPVENSRLQYTDVLPGDSIEFANWLMDKSKEKQVSNVYDVGKHLVQNVTGLPLAIGGLNEGTQMQAIALDYKDKSNKHKKDNYTVHVLGYNPGTTRYKWSQFDVKDTNTDESIFDKAGNHPGTYILGRYTTITNPNHDVLLRDTYNFNDDTLDFYKKKVDDKTANTYEKIRYYAPKYGANNNIEIFQNIPHERIMNWYNQFKNQ